MTEASFITNEDVDKALDFLMSNAEAAAQARAERIYVDEYRKTIKAQIMREHDGKPVGVQEREAYADERYIAHLDAVRSAVATDERMRFMKEANMAVIEAWRTQCSNERAFKL